MYALANNHMNAGFILIEVVDFADFVLKFSLDNFYYFWLAVRTGSAEKLLTEEETDNKNVEIDESKVDSMNRYISEQVSLSDDTELDFLPQKEEIYDEGNKLLNNFSCYTFKSVNSFMLLDIHDIRAAYEHELEDDLSLDDPDLYKLNREFEPLIQQSLHKFHDFVAPPESKVDAPFLNPTEPQIEFFEEPPREVQEPQAPLRKKNLVQVEATVPKSTLTTETNDQTIHDIPDFPPEKQISVIDSSLEKKVLEETDEILRDELYGGYDKEPILSDDDTPYETLEVEFIDDDGDWEDDEEDDEEPYSGDEYVASDEEDLEPHGEHEEDMSDVDDTDLMARLEAKYGKLS